MLSIESLPLDWRVALSRIPAEVLLAIAGKSAVDLTSPDDLLTRKEAAGFLTVSVTYLNTLAASGAGPRITRLGKTVVRYKRADLIEWRDRNGNR